MNKRIEGLIQKQSLTVVVIHDNEKGTNKKRLHGLLEKALRKLKKNGIDPATNDVFLCNFDIWTVLAAKGEDKFLVVENDIWAADGEKPSEVILQSISQGHGEPAPFGTIRNAKEGIQILDSEQFFSD